MSRESALATGLAGSSYDALLALDQSILEIIPAAVYLCSADGMIRRFNACASEFWGRSPQPGDTLEQFIGSLRLYLPDGTPLPHDETPVAVALRTGEPQREQEVTVEKPDGSRRVALANIEPLRESSGRIQGAINCFQDITERRRAEEDLRMSRLDYEDFFENAGVAMNLVSGDGTILRANRAELDLLGYTCEEYVGRHIGEFHADSAAVEEILARLSRGEGLDNISARLRAKDNTIKPVIISSNAHFRDGELVNTRCVTLDATAEEARHRLAAIVESSQDAILSKDLNGTILSWNRGAQRLFGYSDDEAIGKPVTMLIPPDRQDEESAILERLRRSERIEPHDTVRRRKDGSLVDIALTVSPLKNNAGRVTGASTIARDVSDRKKAEQQRDILIHELNHRMKNLLGMVHAIAHQSGRHTDSVPVFLESFEHRLDALSRANALLAKENFGWAELRTLLGDALEPYCGDDSQRVDLAGATVRLEPRIAMTLAMAFHELATNAAKYGALSTPQGRVSVRWQVRNNSPEDVKLYLKWREEHGPPVAPPRHSGFGRRMIERSIQHTLRGSSELEFDPDGVAWKAAIPLAAEQSSS